LFGGGDGGGGVGGRHGGITADIDINIKLLVRGRKWQSQSPLLLRVAAVTLAPKLVGNASGKPVSWFFSAFGLPHRIEGSSFSGFHSPSLKPGPT